MRKLVSISLVLVAMLFCFKSIVTYVTSATDSICFVLDESEEESSEKEDIDEKSNTEEFELHMMLDFIAINSNYKNLFRNHIINGNFSPYFEINSPPPESAI